MKFQNVALISVMCMALILSGCGTGPKLKDVPFVNGWSEAGLSGDSIIVFERNGQYLYAGTDKGLYRHDLTKTDKSWGSLGLNNHSIKDMVIFNANRILAAVAIADFASGDPTLFLTTDGGKSWKNYQNGFGGANNETWVESLEQDPSKPDILYATRGGGFVAKSSDQGKSWKPVSGVGNWDNWGGFNYVLTADSKQPGTIWMGGMNAFWGPSLFKSIDFGNTWKSFQDSVSTDGIETTIYDLIINPLNSGNLLIGEDIGIKLSGDGGQNWTKVYDLSAVYTLTMDPLDDNQVYASGYNQNSTLFFASSPDFGNTWKIVSDSAGPANIYTNALFADTLNGKKVLYFGTNKGVYRYVMAE